MPRWQQGSQEPKRENPETVNHVLHILEQSFFQQELKAAVMNVYCFHHEDWIWMHRDVRPSLRNGRLRLRVGMRLRLRFKEAMSLRPRLREATRLRRG